MSEEKQADKDPERTLMTLEQLSQTIEVMTSVVNRLRQHLSEQMQAKAHAEQEVASAEAEPPAPSAKHKENQRESFVVEIRQQDAASIGKSDKTLH